MRKITIVGPDKKMALVEELVKAIPDMEIVDVKDVDIIEEFQRKSPMERLEFAIRSVVSNSLTARISCSVFYIWTDSWDATESGSTKNV